MSDLRIEVAEDGRLSVPNELYPYLMMLTGHFKTMGGFTAQGLSADVLNLLLNAGWRPPKVVPATE